MGGPIGLGVVIRIRMEGVRESLTQAHSLTMLEVTALSVLVGSDGFGKSITHLKFAIGNVVHVCLLLI